MGLLTDSGFIRKLEMLSLLTRKVLGGNLKADRQSMRKGSGINFADYAEYNLGDDYRNVDWNIFARLEQLVIKLYELEEDARIFILLDLSRSMASKSLLAKQLSAALSYIALNNHDHLTIYGVADELRPVFGPGHGRAKIFPMLEALDGVDLYGRGTDLNACVRSFQLRHRRRGVCVLVSDFFLPGGYREALDLLCWGRHDVFCIQVLDRDELNCDLRGDFRLSCIERGLLRDVTIGAREAAAFASAVELWNDELRDACAKRGIAYVRTTTETAFEEIVQSILRRGGLVS